MSQPSQKHRMWTSSRTRQARRKHAVQVERDVAAPEVWEPPAASPEDWPPLKPAAAQGQWRAALAPSAAQAAGQAACKFSAGASQALFAHSPFEHMLFLPLPRSDAEDLHLKEIMKKIASDTSAPSPAPAQRSWASVSCGKKREPRLQFTMVNDAPARLASRMPPSFVPLLPLLPTTEAVRSAS